MQAQGGRKIRQDVIFGKVTLLKPRASFRYLFKASHINNSVLQPSFKGSCLSPRSPSVTRLMGNITL